MYPYRGITKFIININKFFLLDYSYTMPPTKVYAKSECLGGS